MRFLSGGRGVAVALLFLAMPGESQQQKPAYQGREEVLPEAVAAQPIPFSHRTHTEAARLACMDCHGGAKRNDRAGIPSVKRCMSCHVTIAAGKPAILRLASFGKSGKPVPWVPVYRVPDIVFFSHASHTRSPANVDCVVCHGPVAARDVLAKEVGTSMTVCVNCHRAKSVSTECSLCHQLGQ